MPSIAPGAPGGAPIAKSSLTFWSSATIPSSTPPIPPIPPTPIPVPPTPTTPTAPPTSSAAAALMMMCASRSTTPSASDALGPPVVSPAPRSGGGGESATMPTVRLRPCGRVAGMIVVAELNDGGMFSSEPTSCDEDISMSPSGSPSPSPSSSVSVSAREPDAGDTDVDAFGVVELAGREWVLGLIVLERAIDLDCGSWFARLELPCPARVVLPSRRAFCSSACVRATGVVSASNTHRAMTVPE